MSSLLLHRLSLSPLICLLPVKLNRKNLPPVKIKLGFDVRRVLYGLQEGDGAGGGPLRRRHPLLGVRAGSGVALHRRDLRVAHLRERVLQRRSEPCRRADEPSPRG